MEKNAINTEIQQVENTVNGRPVNMKSAEWLAGKEQEINEKSTIEGVAVALSAAYTYADTDDTAVYYTGQLTGKDIINFANKRIAWLSQRLGMPVASRAAGGKAHKLAGRTDDELRAMASKSIAIELATFLAGGDAPEWMDDAISAALAAAIEDETQRLIANRDAEVARQHRRTTVAEISAADDGTALAALKSLFPNATDDELRALLAKR